ncbi:histidine kinase [Streptomyces coeruleoprunus]|uniref:Histidine kinase n=1 Tax=Streptomyces coeruleoprunus TaxID=285563 RepID=A0ABV9XJI8_9ACTN
MPSFDVSRSRFRLADEHVIVLSELAAGEDLPDEFAAARKELVECGLITRAGKLSHLLLPLMKTVLSPVVVLSLEAAGRQGKLHHGMMIGQDHVVAHEMWPGSAEAEYALVEPKMLVWKLADMVNLQQAPGVREPALSVVETTVGTVEAGLSALATLPQSADQDREHVQRALAAPGTLAEPALTLLAELIVELRSSWRMTAAWQGRYEGQDDVRSRGFAVWDCGPLGYWLRELPAEPVSEERITDDSPFRLVRVEPKAIWTSITDLLPTEEEIRRAEAH